MVPASISLNFAIFLLDGLSLKVRPSQVRDQGQRSRFADDQCAHAHAVAVVGEDGSLGGVDVVADCRVNTVYLIGRNRHADTGAADEDGAVGFAVCDRFATG